MDFRCETMARNVMVDLKFDALYMYVSIESLLKSGLVKKLTGSLYCWVEQCVPTL